MKLHVLTTPEEHAHGVIGRASLEADELYFFHNIGGESYFHMRGVPFDLDIAFLDADFALLAVVRLEAEFGLAPTPPGTIHAVEAPAGYFARQRLTAGSSWSALAEQVHKQRP